MESDRKLKAVTPVDPVLKIGLLHDFIYMTQDLLRPTSVSCVSPSLTETSKML
jgi:hypothetical protein